jgi:predicted transglutaminase-like cysteine proteinase
MRLIISVVALLAVTVALFAVIGPNANTTLYEDPIDPSTIPGYSVTIRTDGDGNGTVAITSVSADLDVTYTASPSPGGSFLGWYDSDSLISGTSTCTVSATSDKVLTATFGTSDQCLVVYDWDYPDYAAGGTATKPALYGMVYSISALEDSLDDDSTPRLATVQVTSPSSLVEYDAACIVALVDYLDSITGNLTALAKADLVLRFVQTNILYTSDAEQYAAEEFWATPFETLCSQRGDCEDTAVLYAAIMAAMGYNVALIQFPTHLGAAIEVSGVTGGSEFVSGSITYTYCETATDGYSPIGALSSSNQITDGTVIPITVVST